jgi:hypothetical protein
MAVFLRCALFERKTLFVRNDGMTFRGERHASTL